MTAYEMKPESAALGEEAGLPVCGRVEARVEGGLMRVAGAGRSLVCRKAVSCLIEPCIRDLVALHDAGEGIAYVTAVLERPSGVPAHLRFDRAVTVDIGGRLDIQVQADTCLSCGRELRLQAGRLQLEAATAECALTSLQALVGDMTLNAGRARIVAQAVDTVSDRLVQVLGHCVRMVEGLDELQAAEIRHSAREQLHLHARNALYTADQLAKIDAGQIHLG